MKKIYLDNAATTSIDKLVLKAMFPYLEGSFGNPSSLHSWGRKAKKATEKARKSDANLLGCQVKEIIFTSCATEANNLALKGVVEATKAFDRVINPAVPRIAWVDYNKREVRDTVDTAKALREKALETRLYAVRVDTCGENIAEGGIEGDKKYWQGKGVTVEGIAVLRRMLDDDLFADKAGIFLSRMGYKLGILSFKWWRSYS